MDSIQIKSPFVGKRQFLRANGQPFFSYLTQNNIHYDPSHFPFVSDHKIPQVKQVFDFDEFINLGSRGSALAYLYNGLGRAFNYVGPVLDLELEHGFNDHTDRHTLWVSQTIVELMQRAGASHDNMADFFGPVSEVLATLVGMTHDLGNFMDRKDHSTYSAWLLSRLFKVEDYDNARWKNVLYSILFHEEPVLVRLGINLDGGTPLQWALILADKMHVGRDRIGDRSFMSGIENNALEEDIHILLNAMVVRSTWYLSTHRFIWHMGFSVDQLDAKFNAFTKGHKRIWVPKKFQDVFKKKGTMYRQSFTQAFNQAYANRMKMAAESAFLLFPYIDKFEVRLADVDTRAKVGSADELVWQTWRKT